MAGEAVPYGFQCVEANGELSNAFSQRRCEDAHNLLISSKPFLMVWIRDGFGWFSAGGGGSCGWRRCRDGSINVAPKFGAVEIRFDLAKPSEVINWFR